MRLFIAIDVNDAVRDAMRRVRQAIDASLASGRQPVRITWVAPEAAHVTLRFIGEVDETVAARLAEVMRADIDLPPFNVVWLGLGVFPSARAPRAIWMGAREPADSLGALAERVRLRIEPVIGRVDARPFRAHLTLGRVRDRAPSLDWRRVLEASAEGPVASRVDHVTLYRSDLSSRGPTYTAISRAALA